MPESSSIELPANWARRFFTIWAGQAFSLFGSSLVQFALVWHLTQETGSATVLATATLVALLPQILLGPVAGTLVDRLNRRAIMVLADSFIALSTLGLAVLFALGQVEIWHIYVIAFIRSLGGAFHWPAMQASTSLMVPDEQLSRIAGMNQTLQGSVGIIAPPAGAVLIGLLPMQGVLFIDIGTAMIAILPLLFISIPQPVRQATAVTPGQETRTSPSFWQDLKEGFTYVAGWPGLLAILILATMINFLLNPAASLMPLLVTKHFGRGALDLGALESIHGIGMIAGGVILSLWGGFKQRIVTSLSGIAGIGVGVLVVGLAPASLFSLAFIGFFTFGFMGPIANGPLFALLQSNVRPDMQGRVMSLISSAATAMSPLGLMIAGPVSDWLGVRVWFWIGGGVCLLMSLGAFLVPAILNIEQNNNGRKIETSAPALVE